jgi:hypothetical protein
MRSGCATSKTTTSNVADNWRSNRTINLRSALEKRRCPEQAPQIRLDDHSRAAYTNLSGGAVG